MRNYFLTTERLGFGLWSINDFDLAKSLWGNANVTKHIGGVYSDEKVTARLTKEIASYQNHRVQYWPIFDLVTNEFVGCCGLCVYDKEKGIYELGFHLKEKFWGKGLAYEAATAALEYGKMQLKIIQYFAGHNPHNIASKGLLLKLGFEYSHDEYYEGTGLQHPSYMKIIKN